MANIPQLSNMELIEKLREILQSWPLYRCFSYQGEGANLNLPSEISLHCDNCGKEQLWENLDSSVSFPDTRYDGFVPERSYRCKNCEQSRETYYGYWYRRKDLSAQFFKVGQYPPLEERIPKELKLEGEDLDFYQKALRCRNFNYGLAGVAYLRRVIENRMNEMLDLIAQEARTANFAEQDLKKLEQVKAGKPFSDKVDYAAGILPPHLRPGDHNPIERLHDITSDGVHAKSDEECIEIFDKSRFVFEYTFKKLQVDAAEARTFAEKLAKLTKPKKGSSEG